MKRNKIIAITILVAVIIVGVILAVVFGSAKKQTNTPTTTPEQTTVTETTTADPNAGKVISKLTGEYVKKSIANKRPVALMYNNIPAAGGHPGRKDHRPDRQGVRPAGAADEESPAGVINAIPHSGLYNADVCYEAPVEGSITRIMGIFENYSKLKKMGSVRSCRIYYCAFANEWDAIYSHFGQSKYALDYLKSGSIDKVGSLNAESAFYRTSDRVAPHNCFTSGKGLDSAIKKFKYRTSYKKKYTSHFNFAKSGSKIALDSKKQLKKLKLVIE